MINQQLPAKIATVYTNYLKAFMKRADVQNGKLVSYHDNQNPTDKLRPENWVNLGDARVTTGFCVSFCQGIMYDKLFQILLESRNAVAKLVSIDIKEQYYGHCKPSYVQNKWHTAILLKDNGILFILDPTCAQFGNQFVGKFVWDAQTWLDTFRSPSDCHTIEGFDNDTLFNIPTSVLTANYDQAFIKVVDALHNVVTIDNSEREYLANFFLNGVTLLNKKITVGNLTDNDFKYMETINNLLKQFNYKEAKNEYYIMEFTTKDGAKKWINDFIKGGCILPMYIGTSPSIQDACNWFGFDINKLNIESESNTTYIVLNFKSIHGVDVSKILNHLSTFIPYGIGLTVENPSKDIYNGGELLPENSYNIKKKTNTIYIDITC